MKEFRTAVRFSLLSVRDELGKVSFYVFLGILFVTIQLYFSGVAGYLRENSGRMNIWELYIWFLSSRNSQIIYFLGVIFLAGQVIHFQSETAYYLIRTTRFAWTLSRILSLFFLIAGLQLFLLLCFAAACGGRVTLTGSWSEAAETAMKQSVSSIGVHDIVWANKAMLPYNPNKMGWTSAALAVLSGLFTGLILMLCYMKRRPAYGVAVVLFLWWFDHYVEFDVLAPLEFFEGRYVDHPLAYVTPYGLSRIYRLSPLVGSISLPYALAFLAGWGLILALLILRAGEKIDFVKLE